MQRRKDAPDDQAYAQEPGHRLVPRGRRGEADIQFVNDGQVKLTEPVEVRE